MTWIKNCQILLGCWQFFYLGFDFPLKDVSFYYPVVGMICLTIVWRMADSIFSGKQNAVNELFVLTVTRQIEIHLLNRTNLSSG